ncbi:MAG TPA: DMT family transporter [Paracoccaceae bacterium]|nr:DMT family transporter [Paracoccaceae bacterium]
MPRLTDNMRAAVYMMTSQAGFALNDAMMKLSSETLNLFQAISLRGFIAGILIAILAFWFGALRHRIVRRDRIMLVLRSVGEAGAAFCFLGALFNMPIANATAILQSVPLAVALGAAIFLGERIGWRRYLAISIGFLGVIIIVRPGGEGFNAYALLALAAVGFMVVRDLATRRLTAEIPSLLVTLVSMIVITATAGLFSLVEGWRPVGAAPAGYILLASLCLIVAVLFGVMTIRLGAIGFTQPFRYTLLPWAILFGILFFGEYPDMPMLVGSTLILGTGLFTFYRERAGDRRQARLRSRGHHPLETAAPGGGRR